MAKKNITRDGRVIANVLPKQTAENKQIIEEARQVFERHYGAACRVINSQISKRRVGTANDRDEFRQNALCWAWQLFRTKTINGTLPPGDESQQVAHVAFWACKRNGKVFGHVTRSGGEVIDGKMIPGGCIPIEDRLQRWPIENERRQVIDQKAHTMPLLPL